MINDSYFPLLIQYEGSPLGEVVSSPEQIISGKSFKVIETQLGKAKEIIYE